MSFAYEIQPKKPVKTVDYKTDWGIWRTLDYPTGQRFREYKSHLEVLGRPFICIAWGMDPATEKMVTARGFIAVGQFASGMIAIGQFVNGGVSIGQFASGRVAAIGQFVAAPFALGQCAIGLAVISQFAAAGWGICQLGITVFGGIGQSLLNLLN